MSLKKPSLKPFEKDFAAKDNYENGPWPGGRNNKSYQYTTEMVHTFNSNKADRSPTTSASEYRGINKNKFLKKSPFNMHRE
jgi:hypothetical protein